MCCLPPPAPSHYDPVFGCKTWPSSPAVRPTGAGDSAQDVPRHQVPPSRQPVTVYAGTVRHGDPLLLRKYTRSRFVRPLLVAGVEYDRVNPNSWRCTIFDIELSAVHAPIYLTSSVCLVAPCVVWIRDRKHSTEHSPQMMPTEGVFLGGYGTDICVRIYQYIPPPFPLSPFI